MSQVFFARIPMMSNRQEVNEIPESNHGRLVRPLVPAQPQEHREQRVRAGEAADRVVEQNKLSSNITCSTCY